MPTSSPVVNGIDSRPASSSTRSRTAGSLSGEPKWASPFSVEQPGRGGLQHHPHRRRDRLEPVHLLPRHDAGVEVRQQPGLLQHPDRHRPHVGQRRVVALLVQPLPRLGPAVLGPVAQGEQRLQAAQLGTLAGDVEDLVGGEVRRPPLARGVPRRLDERAVVAPVPAQPGDRDEHLGGVRAHAGVARRPPGRRRGPGRPRRTAGPAPRHGRPAAPSPRPGRERHRARRARAPGVPVPASPRPCLTVSQQAAGGASAGSPHGRAACGRRRCQTPAVSRSGLWSPRPCWVHGRACSATRSCCRGRG